MRTLPAFITVQVAIVIVLAASSTQVVARPAKSSRTRSYGSGHGEPWSRMDLNMWTRRRGRAQHSKFTSKASPEPDTTSKPAATHHTGSSFSSPSFNISKSTKSIDFTGLQASSEVGATWWGEMYYTLAGNETLLAINLTSQVVSWSVQLPQTWTGMFPSPQNDGGLVVLCYSSYILFNARGEFVYSLGVNLNEFTFWPKLGSGGTTVNKSNSSRSAGASHVKGGQTPVKYDLYWFGTNSFHRVDFATGGPIETLFPLPGIGGSFYPAANEEYKLVLDTLPPSGWDFGGLIKVDVRSYYNATTGGVNPPEWHMPHINGELLCQQEGLGAAGGTDDAAAGGYMFVQNNTRHATEPMSGALLIYHLPPPPTTVGPPTREGEGRGGVVEPRLAFPVFTGLDYVGFEHRLCPVLSTMPANDGKRSTTSSNSMPDPAPATTTRGNRTAESTIMLNVVFGQETYKLQVFNTSTGSIIKQTFVGSGKLSHVPVNPLLYQPPPGTGVGRAENQANNYLLVWGENFVAATYPGGKRVANRPPSPPHHPKGHAAPAAAAANFSYPWISTQLAESGCILGQWESAFQIKEALTGMTVYTSEDIIFNPNAGGTPPPAYVRWGTGSLARGSSRGGQIIINNGSRVEIFDFVG